MNKPLEESPIWWKHGSTRAQLLNSDRVEVEIYRGVAEVVVASVVYELQCVVALCYYPNNQIQYRLVKEDQEADKFFHEIYRRDILEFRLDGRNIPVVLSSIRSTLSFEMHDRVELIFVSKLLTDYKVGNKSTTVEQIVFQLFNFPKFHSNELLMAKEGLNAYSVDSIHLRLMEYCIEIQSHRSSKDTFESLQSVGGFQSTYLVHIRRMDAQQFSLQDIDSLVELLECGLSFASGEFKRLVCPLGFTEGQIVCEKLDLPMHVYHSHVGCINFFQARSSENHPIEILLNERFNSLADVWHKESTIARSVNMYCQANHQKYIDTSLLLIQSGMETLAYHIFVKKLDAQKRKFKNIDAHEKLEMVMSAAKIPTSITFYSGNFSHIKEDESSKTKICDRITHLFTFTRNSFVHADNSFLKESGMTTDNIAELQQIMLHIFELCILYVLGYRGTYVNRLKQRRVGEVELVPWAQN